MREKYGELILPKGFILYHTSNEYFTVDSYKNNHILYCSFHPSEGKELDYITKIILKKDISLFFAIDFTVRDDLHSKPICAMKELNKTDFFIKNIKIIKDYESLYLTTFKKYNFNGLIEMGIIYDGQLRICLINDPNIYDFETDQIKTDWKREGMNYDKTIVIQKRWGNNYPMYFNKDIILNVNERYKYFIELFLQNIEIKKYKFNKSLHVLLRDVQINYHKCDLKIF
jgi:hypothetical protein